MDKFCLQWNDFASNITEYFKELREEGINPRDLESTSHTVVVPQDPRDLLKRVGDSCAEGFSPGALKESNYFYYFSPLKEGCTLPMTTEPQFNVRSLLPQTETFPEYDRLTEDGVIECPNHKKNGCAPFVVEGRFAKVL